MATSFPCHNTPVQVKQDQWKQGIVSYSIRGSGVIGVIELQHALHVLECWPCIGSLSVDIQVFYLSS